MKSWSVFKVNASELEEALNRIEAMGKTIFKILPENGNATKFLIVAYVDF